MNLSKVYLLQTVTKFGLTHFLLGSYILYIFPLCYKVDLFQASLGPHFSVFFPTAIPILWNLINTSLHIIHTLQDFILFYYISS